MAVAKSPNAHNKTIKATALLFIKIEPRSNGSYFHLGHGYRFPLPVLHTPITHCESSHMPGQLPHMGAGQSASLKQEASAIVESVFIRIRSASVTGTRLSEDRRALNTMSFSVGELDWRVNWGGSRETHFKTLF